VDNNLSVTVQSIIDIFKRERTYIIDTPVKLLNFANAVNNGNEFGGQKIILANNIDMEGIDMPSIGFFSKDGAK